MTSTQKEMLKSFKELSLKLGKLPSNREAKKFICSQDKITNHFGAFSKLKAQALEAYPELESLEMPVRLNAKDIEVYRLELEKKSVKTNNKEVMTEASFLDYLKQYSESVFKGSVKPVAPYKSNKPTDRVFNIVFSDVHIGADLKKDETGTADYGTLEESRRVAAIVQEVINYKPQYRDTTELEVLLLGDLCQGQLHDPRDGASLAEQLCRVIHIFTQALQQLSANFKKVRVRCQTGNHGRNTARHKTRAVNQKWDSHESVIYYALKTALRDQKNVEFFIPKTPYGSYEVFGEKILYTHGDTFLNPGYPNKSINIKNLENQLNQINASLDDKKEFKAAVVGHVHIASQTYLSNGCVVMTNGALIEPDAYAVSIGIVETQTGQMLFESVPGYAVGDTRFIRVGKEHDDDASLDKVIQPFKSL